MRCDDGWTPILSADGVYYCSRRCGGGKFCKKADYDRAVSDAAALAARMGPGWTPYVHENLGWHYKAVSGPDKIYEYGNGRFSAWIETPVKQFIVHADDPHDALGFAKQAARTHIARIEEHLKALAERCDP